MVQDGILTSMKLLHNNLNGDVGMVLAKLGELQSVGGVCALQELNLASNRCRGKLPALPTAGTTSTSASTARPTSASRSTRTAG